MAPRNITVEIKLWMRLAALAALALFVSYIMAVTVPDCPACTPQNQVSFPQVWHCLMSVVTGIGSIVLTIVSIACYLDGAGD